MGLLKNVGKRILKTLLEADQIKVELVGSYNQDEVKSREQLVSINVTHVRRIVARLAQQGLKSAIVITVDDEEARIEL